MGLLPALLLAMLAAGICHPSFFVRHHSRDSCTQLPTKQYKHHGAPAPDPDIAMDLLQGGSRVESYCPGVTYQLKIVFGTPDEYEALLTSNLAVTPRFHCTSEPDSTKALCCQDGSGTRWILANSFDDRAHEYTLDVTVPCDKKGVLRFEVLGARSSHSHFHTSTREWQLGDKCNVKECQVSGSPPDSQQEEQQQPLDGVMQAPATAAPTPYQPGQHPAPLPTPQGPTPQAQGPATPSAPSNPLPQQQPTPAAKPQDAAKAQVEALVKAEAEARGRVRQQQGQGGGSEQIDVTRVKGADAVAQHAQRPAPALQVQPLRSVEEVPEGVPLTAEHLCSQAPPAPSPLGYAASVHLDSADHIIALHWSYGPCAPSNPCTQGASWRGAAPPAGQAQHLLHMAAEANATGYVSIGFGVEDHSMGKNDVVLGYAGSVSHVAAYRLGPEQYQLHETDRYPAAVRLMEYSGVVETNDKRTIVCFARALEVAGAEFSHSLKLDQPTAINWAIGRDDRMVFHMEKGGKKVNLGSGVVVESGHHSHPGAFARRLHAGVMIAVWWLLVPLGVMSARHRWAFGDSKLQQTHSWFLAHQGFQALALALHLSSGAIALLLFRTPPTAAGVTHKWLGIVTLAAALLQVAAALWRPKPSSSWRVVWLASHYWMGMLLVLTSWVTTGFGMFLLHSLFHDPYLSWLLPCITSLLVLLAVEGVLQYSRRRHLGRAGPNLLVHRSVALPEFQRLKESPSETPVSDARAGVCV